MKVYLDANFFIFAAFNYTKKGQAARAILKEIIDGKKEALTSILALDEVIWVLFKNNQKEQIRACIEEIYTLPHLKIITGSALIPLRAVQVIEEYHLKPRDAFHLSFMQEENITVIISDDSDFDKVKGINRIKLEPY